MQRIALACILVFTLSSITRAQESRSDPPKVGSTRSGKIEGGNKASQTPVDKASAADGSAKEKKSSGKESATGLARGGRGGGNGKPDEPEKSTYSFNLPGPDGNNVPLASFKGKVILLVNLARNSDYNQQLPALIALSEKYKEKGLVVIGVPSNDFGAAEPGTDVDIQKVYKADNKVPFPLMARSILIGEEALPFYDYLTKGKAALPGGSIHWNYTKFLIDRNGKVIARLEPDVAPDSAEMLSTLDQIFSGGFKGKPKEDPKGSPMGGAQGNAE